MKWMKKVAGENLDLFLALMGSVSIMTPPNGSCAKSTISLFCLGMNPMLTILLYGLAYRMWKAIGLLHGVRF